jgi:hypothetical protein
MRGVFDFLLELGYEGVFFRNQRAWPLEEFRSEYQKPGLSRREYANNFVFLPGESRPQRQRRVA